MVFEIVEDLRSTKEEASAGRDLKAVEEDCLVLPAAVVSGEDN